jgi:hypothetical protein
MKNHLILGNYNALCDSCGRKFKAFDLQKRLDGLMVCREDFEQRHPQDLLKVQREKIAVPWSRPYAAEDTYIPENLWVKPIDNMGIVDFTAFNFTKIIQDLSTGSGALNAYAFDEFALNQTVATGVPSETAIVSEIVLVVLGRNLFDTPPITETFAKAITTRFAESLSLSDSLRFVESNHDVDNLSFSESKSFVMGKTIAETISVTEVLQNGVSRPLSDTLTISDSVTKWDNEKTIETMSIAEIKAFTIGSTQTDSLSITENFSYIQITPSNQYLNGAALNSTSLG